MFEKKPAAVKNWCLNKCKSDCAILSRGMKNTVSKLKKTLQVSIFDLVHHKWFQEIEGRCFHSCIQFTIKLRSFFYGVGSLINMKKMWFIAKSLSM